MEKYFSSNAGTGYEYVIRQAAAGNWCVDCEPYAGDTETYACFQTEDEAYSFILGWEHGVCPEALTELDESDLDISGYGGAVIDDD